jgi:LysR family transcriptional regulator, cyn operon transcriptional activator
MHPSIKINVVCPTTPGIVNHLKAGSIDFGIINMPFIDEQLIYKRIMEIRDCFVAGEKYRHLSYMRQPLCDIAKQPLLLLDKNSNSRSFIDKYFMENSVLAAPDFELGNIDLLIRFAKYGFGIACVIKNFIEEELENGQLYEIIPIEKIPTRSIGTVWLKDVSLSTAAGELIKNLDDDRKYEI